MANQIQRKGTSLIEISAEEAAKQAPQPTTPAGVASAGGTPAQAAAAPTPNAKAPVLKEAVDRSLQREERLTQQQPSAAVQGVAQQAQAKADRLKALGSLGSRVEDKLQAQLTQQSQAQVTQQIDDTKVAALVGADATKQAAVKAALQAYLADPSQANLAALGTVTGSVVDPNTLLKTGAQSVQSAVQAAPTQPVTMAQVGWGELDPTQVATDLGLTVEQVNALTPEQISARVADLQAREFQSQQQLKAELATASPQRRQQIWAQIRAGQMAGINASELAVDQLQQELVSDAEVEFAGKTYTLNELLQSETVSQEILAAAQDPERLKQLESQHPALGAWVRSNVDALDELAKTQSQAATELGAVQTGVKTTADQFDSKLLEVLGVQIPTVATAEQAQQIKDQLANSSVAQAVLTDSTLSEVFTKNPALVQQLAGETKEQILARKKMTDSIGSDAALQALLGFDPTTGLFTGDVTAATAKKALYDAVPAAAKGDPTFLEAVRAGDIDDDTLKHLARYPEAAASMLANYKGIQERTKLLNRMIEDNDISGFSKFLFGDTNPAEMSKAYKDAQRVVKYPGSFSKDLVARSKELIDKIKSYGDFDGDGDVDRDDVNKLMKSPSTMRMVLGKDAAPKTTLRRDWYDPLTGVKNLLTGYQTVQQDVVKEDKSNADKAKAAEEAAKEAARREEQKKKIKLETEQKQQRNTFTESARQWKPATGTVENLDSVAGEFRNLMSQISISKDASRAGMSSFANHYNTLIKELGEMQALEKTVSTNPFAKQTDEYKTLVARINKTNELVREMQQLVRSAELPANQRGFFGEALGKYV